MALESARANHPPPEPFQMLSLGGVWSTLPPPPPCGDTWVCQVVLALREIAQATALHSQKEIKADQEPEGPVLGAKVCKQDGPCTHCTSVLMTLT